MTIFTVKYLGKSMFTILSPSGHQVINSYRCDSLSEVQETARGFCSSWLNSSIVWDIDLYITEYNYRR